MSHALEQPDRSSERMSLSQAARWTGLPKAYLRELVESGQLSVYLVPENGEIKQRVTHAGLVDAGLIPRPAAEPDRDLGDLIALVREQSTRIGALEEQRFQLGAQLGAAFERIASLEEQVQALPVLQSDLETALELVSIEPEPVELTDANGHAPSALSLRSAAQRVGELGARQSIRLFTRARRQIRRS